MTATDPTPQPATHASGPLAGQPVTPTPVDQVPVVVLEDALCRRVWAGALRYGAAHLATIGLSRGPDALRDLADHIDAGALTPWAEPAPEPDGDADCQPPTEPSDRCDCGREGHDLAEVCPATEPPLTSYAGTMPDLTGGVDPAAYVRAQWCPHHDSAAECAAADLQSGPANASGPAGGPGWDREDIGATVRWLRSSPPPGVDDADVQVDALLASYDDAAEDIAFLRGDRARLRAGARSECDRLRGERNDLRHQASALEAMLVGVRSECDRMEQLRVYDRETIARMNADRDRLERLVGEEGQPGWDGCSRAEAIRQAEQKHEFGMRMSDALETVKDDLFAAREEVDRTRLQAAEARTVADSYAEQLATARRDAAAAALAALRQEIDPDDDTRDVLTAIDTWAAEYRAGTRPVPGSPEPAPAGGEEPSDD
jgi:hypothetical protein